MTKLKTFLQDLQAMGLWLVAVPIVLLVLWFGAWGTLDFVLQKAGVSVQASYVTAAEHAVAACKHSVPSEPAPRDEEESAEDACESNPYAARKSEETAHLHQLEQERDNAGRAQTEAENKRAEAEHGAQHEHESEEAESKYAVEKCKAEWSEGNRTRLSLTECEHEHHYGEGEL